ncbi:citrate lyase ligase [Treponema pedis]|uniref:citrate lyase ligase n=1 Tax=Treponema pedis TaxID=409322 RepID=UPI003D19B6A8
MTNLQKINLNILNQKEKFISLLEQNGLREDSLESLYGIFDDADNLLACGGREKNILKCFAVNSKFQGLGLTDEILSALLKEAYSENYKSFFIFTKKTSAHFFTNAGFTVLETAADSALLYRGEKTAEQTLKEKFLEYCPKAEIKKKLNAAIVINANPFTLGHRHLIEEALKYCNNEKLLFVFVVENDKSFFSFKDRFFLVKENVKDLKNIFVLPSSEFLISEATFPSYFLKETALVQKNQTELDARIFLKYFVPFFNIGVRFLGEEPLDISTGLYNKTLLAELPPKCEVKIIKRKKTEGHNEKIISATAVRRAYKNNSLEEIKDYVSSFTYNFLQGLKNKNYGK